MALVSIIIIVSLGVLLYLCYRLFFSNSNDIIIAALLCILVFLILTGYILHNSIAQLEKIGDYSKLGPFGDYVGGLLNPFISVFAIIAAGFAFYAQYDANKQIQKQFEIQQFETRLFKMLDYYNISVDNLKFIGRKSGNVFEGKTVFPHLISNYNKLKKEIFNFCKKTELELTDLVKEDYKQKLIDINKHINLENWIILEITYIIFFYGVGVSGRKNIKTALKDKYNEKSLNRILNYLSNKPVEYHHYQQIERFKEIENFLNEYTVPNNEKFDKYYNGHQNNLGHYYRHIFMIIKYINTQKFLSYVQKWEYSKLLRTQLSNHEQELFFLNSITIIGREWELNHENENLQLITKYDLIKNISKATRDKYKVEDFYPDVVYEDYAKNTVRRENSEKNIYT